MEATAAQNPTDLLAPPLALGDLLDATSVEDVLRSFYSLFRVGVRIASETGGNLARSRKSSELDDYLAEFPRVAERLGEEHRALRSCDLGDEGELLHQVFTGASYYVVAIGHDGRQIGRFMLGPFVTPDVLDVPHALADAHPELDRSRLRELLNALPRMRQDTAKGIGRHLSVTLDALIYAGYRAKLGEQMQLASVCENARQLEQAERERRALELAIGEALHLPNELLASISSELEGPLGSIVELARRLLEDSGGGPHARLAKDMRQEVARLSDVVRRWSDLSQLNREVGTLEKQLVDPAKLLEEVGAQLRAALGEAARVSVECEQRLPRLWADPVRLAHVLRVLAENAGERAADSFVELSVRRLPSMTEAPNGLESVLLGAPPDMLEFRIAGGGPGVPAGGAGLGIVRRLVEAHGGQLSVEKNHQRGSVFVVTLAA